MNCISNHIPLFLIVLLTGCTKHRVAAPSSDDASTAAELITYDSEWNDRNADIYRYLLAELREPIPDRINFITTTPMAKWGETGNWSTLPPEELKSLPNASKYRAANEAYLKDDHVLEKRTDAKSWMHWISVKRWINDTEVEVEDGVWCCPLGGGASTTIYKKVDGIWQIKEYGGGWVS
jgi:hypothetical protein